MAGEQGEGRTLRFTRQALFVGPHENATVADLDRDGRLDIGRAPDRYKAPDFVPRSFRPNHVSKDYMHEKSVHVYDVDRTGGRT